MTRIQKMTEHYVDLMLKLGRIRFSLLLIFILLVIPFTITFFFALLLGIEEKLHIIRSLTLSLVAGLVLVYFFYSIIEQIQRSRQQLSLVVDKLNVLHQRDIALTKKLKENIDQLNQEIDIRKKTEAQYQDVLNTLQIEITERKKAQTELEQQSSFLRSFIDSSPDLIYYRNEEGQFLGCNHSVELLTGKTEKELIGLCPSVVYPFDIAQTIIGSDDKVSRYNIRLTYEQWVTYPDGHRACFEVKKIPFYDNQGKRQGFMGFGRDVTERKSYQHALEKASQEKTTFISTISHELRTPLNGIIGLSNILLDEKLTKEQRNYLKTIHISATTLNIIFNDVVEFDKIERRKIQIEQVPINLSEFFSNLENVAKIMTEQKKLYFTLTVDDNCPNYFLGDHARLNQILWNIIHNAVKFTQQGGIIVHVHYSHRNEKLFIQIKDTGIGINHNEFNKIFTMYYQIGHNGDIPTASGTGIGLAISKRLAKAMHGDIQVESKLNKGSCFTVEVLAPAVSEVDTDNQTELLPSLHIFLVEDVELNVIVARSVLEKLGHTIEVAMTGKEALEKFSPNGYDLVLLDIQLPDMTGLEVAQQLRKKYAGQNLPPLIAFTANTLKPKKEYFDAGIDDVITKPLQVNALNTIINRYWGKAETQLAVSNLKNSETLDTTMLVQYLELVGAKLMNQNIDIFEKILPSYLDKLKQYYYNQDYEGVTLEGHKIKGAAGSLGLNRLQQLAQQIQTSSLPKWQENVVHWIETLTNEWKIDIQILREWITAHETK